MRYYPEQDSNIRNKINVELDLSNHATKSELKDAKGADTSHLTAKNILLL